MRAIARYTAPIRRRKCSRRAVIFAAVRQVILPSAVIFVLWTSDISRYMREKRVASPHHPGAATCSECILLRAERLDALSEHSEERKGDNPAPQDTATARKACNFTDEVNFTAKPRWGSPKRRTVFWGCCGEQLHFATAETSLRSPASPLLRRTPQRKACPCNSRRSQFTRRTPQFTPHCGISLAAVAANITAPLVQYHSASEYRCAYGAPRPLHEKRTHFCVLFLIDRVLMNYAAM